MKGITTVFKPTFQKSSLAKVKSKMENLGKKIFARDMTDEEFLSLVSKDGLKSLRKRKLDSFNINRQLKKQKMPKTCEENFQLI